MRYVRLLVVLLMGLSFPEGCGMYVKRSQGKSLESRARDNPKTSLGLIATRK